MNRRTPNKNMLKKHLENLNKSIDRLLYSYDICSKISSERGHKNEEYWEHYEALTARYGRSVDILVNSVLRYIDVMEYIEPGTTIDVTNRAEKRGFVDSAQDLRVLKDLRNEIVHNYDSDDCEGVFDDSLRLIPDLLEIINKVKIYCGRFLE
ncbi:MAG: hypothetical protein FWE57_00895 [Chitinispirillia bacterium]|nr:hypothetical protein [Chitinispirillia bacterium]